MPKKRKIHYKIISFLIIISFLTPVILLSKPKQANAFLGIGDIVTDIGTNIQTALTAAKLTKSALKKAGEQILMAATKKLLQKMTESTVTWINTGFHGNPLFIEHPESFFRDVGKFTIRNTVDMIGYNDLEFPFGRDTAIGLINSYNRQFEINAKHSLSKVINDPTLLTQYRDFNYGGWNGFLATTQYKQNSPYGFRILVKENLASQLEGTLVSPAQKIKEELQQGMGFLSPKTCLTNDKYNNGLNEFQKPTYKPTKYTTPIGLSGESLKQYKAGFLLKEAETKTKWEEDNGCTKFESTTPGSVVANQITTAMGSQFRKTELGAALGNSISAITDALLNHFMQEGLNKLATKINPKSDPNNWDYEGNSLGVATSSNSFKGGWNTTPDEILDVGEFQRGVEQGIADTIQELQLIDSLNQAYVYSWQKSRELDICQPGPDVGWRDRLEKEKERSTNSKKLQERLNGNDSRKASNAQLAISELKFAVDLFKDWIENKMLFELPNSSTYIGEVEEIYSLSQQSYDDLTNRKREKVQIFGRLKSIQLSLSGFETNPESGTTGEKSLIAIKKQYDTIRPKVSSADSIEEIKSDLDTLNDTHINLIKLVNECVQKRAETYGNIIPQTKTYPINIFTITTTTASDTYSYADDIKTETINYSKIKDVGYSNDASQTPISFVRTDERKDFCDNPISNGYNHETFRNSADPTGVGTITPPIPVVNAYNVDGDVDIKINCENIYRANVTDYKGNFPNTLNTTTPSYGVYKGTCTYTTGAETKNTEETQYECYTNKKGLWSPTIINSVAKIVATNTTTTNTTVFVVPTEERLTLTAIPSTATVGVPITLTTNLMTVQPGPFRYYFYCDRQQTDPDFVIHRPFAGDTNPTGPIIDDISSSTKQCTYTQTGTKYPKVMVEGINANGTSTWKQAYTARPIQVQEQ